MASQSKTLVVGIGNDFRSDDAAGLIAARLIEGAKIDGVDVIVGISDGTSLLDAWADYDMVILIDSVQSGKEPGHLYIFDGLNETIPEEYFTGYSTHSFSIPETVKLGRVLGQLPKKLIIYGIEGSTFEAGNYLTPAVKDSVSKLVEIIGNHLQTKSVEENKDA